MLVNNNNSMWAYGCIREDRTNVEVEATLERKVAESNMIQNTPPFFVEGEPCYESFFMDCLSRPNICSSFFVSAFSEILKHLLTLQSSSLFAQERDLTYFFNGLVFLYVECGCGTFKTRFINFLSILFVKREAMYTRYQFLHKYNVFKALLSLIRQGDFRIREFIYNTDFVDVLFELPNDDPVILMLKWKFVNIITTNTDIRSGVLEGELIKSFLSNNITTSFGAVNSLVKDTLQNTKKGMEHVFNGFV